MAIQPNIALMYQPPRFESPFNMLAQISQIQQAQQANALNQMRMQQLEREMAREESLSNALRSGQPLTLAQALGGGTLGLNAFKAQQEQLKAQEERQLGQRRVAAEALLGTRPELGDFAETFRVLKEQGVDVGPRGAELMLMPPEQRAREMQRFIATTPGMGEVLAQRGKTEAETQRALAATAASEAQQRKLGMEMRGEMPQQMPESIRAGLAFGQLSPEQQADVTRFKQAGVAQPPKPLTPLQESVDKKFADDLVQWQYGGGVNIMKNVSQIGDAIRRLESGKPLTGPLIGIQPDVLLAVTNPSAVDVRQRVEQIAQESLRPILGAQFTQKEGEAFIARVYNPSLKPEVNASRLRAMLLQLEKAAEQKKAMVDYANENGTLVGFKGKVPTIADFYAAINEKPAEGRGAVGGESSDRSTKPDISKLPQVPSGASIGAKTDRGWEVLKGGRVIGYAVE